MRDDQDLSRWFAGVPLSVACCPSLPAAASAALSAQGAILLETGSGSATESAALAPGCDVLLVSSRSLCGPDELTAVARALAIVLHLEDGDDPVEPNEVWRQAISAGVQDLLTTAELSAPGAIRRLEAAALRHRLTEQARSAYATDLSTGLPHRQQLLEHMTQLLALRRREPAPMGLLVFHLGTASPSITRLGVEDAAALRRKVAVRLRSGLRASDVVASIGSDEFAVLLTSVEAPTDIERVVAKLVMLARRPLSIGGQAMGIELCPGIARYPDDGDDATLLLQHAQRQARSSALAIRHDDARDPAANDPSH